MALNQSYVGRTYPPTPPYRVGREKIREFAAAIGSNDPLHFDLAAAQAKGYPNVVAPPTFPIALTMGVPQMLAEDREFGLDYSRVVHGDQKFSYTRPIYAGDELVCTTTIAEVTSRGGHDFLTTRTEIATAAGEPVATVSAKIVVRGE
jgi:acyl dehydratase